MKKLFNNLKHDKQVYLFVVLGVVLVIFPEQIAVYTPHMVGAALIVYAAVNIFMEIRFPESTISLGDAAVRGVLGIAILSIIWAVLSLNDMAEEINDFYRTKKFRPVGAVSIVLTIIFSAMLMLDPFGHFVFHIRILGLEMIAETFIRRRED